MTLIERDPLRREPEVCDLCASSLAMGDEAIFRVCRKRPDDPAVRQMLRELRHIYAQWLHMILRVDDERVPGQVDEVMRRIELCDVELREMFRRVGS